MPQISLEFEDYTRLRCEMHEGRRGRRPFVTKEFTLLQRAFCSSVCLADSIPFEMTLEMDLYLAVSIVAREHRADHISTIRFESIISDVYYIIF